MQSETFHTGKHILAVDDEWDVIETIQEILEGAVVDVAQDYDTASQKISEKHYDLAILDIMGVNGITLLEECVKMDIPAVMLTANAMNPDMLMQSIQKGAICYLSKEHLSELDVLINDLMDVKNNGRPTWKFLFDKLENHFDQRFGRNWKNENHSFWNDFQKEWTITKGIQERLLHDKDILGKGI